MTARSDGGADRAVSTVADVALCLLLLSAAVGTLALPVSSPASRQPQSDPAATAEALATANVSVPYALDTSDVAAESSASSAEADRVAHGSYATLLAEAAVENATLDGRPLSNASDGFGRAVAAAVSNTTGATGGRTRVVARWTPYQGAVTRGVVTAGPRPPRDAPTAAATLPVPSRFPDARERAVVAARREGYGGVARVLAAATIDGWFPPGRARLALRGDHPVDALLERRYRRTAALLGTTVGGPVEAAEPRRANTRLRTALARRYEMDLRNRFDSPMAAARTVRIGEVRVVVTTW
ncbi:hypothetical protein BRC89_06215 [Halobacteriales archaeon QS_4_70_19]|nr:MAG: hypothetical protein BRC89_06215 [Halobacteriales archaeon QS_4_70_19]